MSLTRYTKTGSPATAAATSPQAKKIGLLYVEDEDINWEVTLLHLRERYDVERAANSREAFELIGKKKFHAILMDIQLQESDLDGIEITQVLRGTYQKLIPAYARDVSAPDIPIIFMTAYSARYKKSDLLQLGGDELVTKPIDFTHLALCLTRCLLKPQKSSPSR